MAKINQRIKIDFGSAEVFPAVVDYDFVKNRPRGGSSRIDFFSYGKLTEVFESIAPRPRVFVKKDNTFFEKGFFLVDFSTIQTEPEAFVKMIKGLGEGKIYLEDSSRYPIGELAEKLSGSEIILMSFG